ncbi:shikimate kinase [Candidatus Liberibacter americanus]|uniref:Shikimate kinase n=1 Tax=Candidatus Liberibacter americanus str. Sao Paulo TaxID=1261131 RepID=U6B5X3_9HYPH|nr:shikimate kinase [Candidatus Liberibacter americanus]AHA28333.1 Shikimate kinase [Candidatus Liberibacter americanus str. Sao Paulo]EMS36623.1 shikimate kinase [Candidatus Liberibacter americanus PW_SP]
MIFRIKKDSHIYRDSHIRSTLSKKNFVLVGLMGAGKTTVGSIMSSIIKIPFVDVDHEIEKLSSMSIEDFFNYHGEDAFRDLELRVTKFFLQGTNRIIALGGGGFINDEIREYILEKGITLWLQANFDILWNRINNSLDKRPLLNLSDPKETLRKLMESRNSIYAKADMVLVSSDLSIEETVDNAISKLADYNF